MAAENFTLTTFYNAWKAYQEKMRDAIAPLTAEQLTLRAAPHLRSVGENVAHIIGCRAGWFNSFLGEPTTDEVKTIADWEEKDARPAAELVQGLDQTWQFMRDCIARWSDADMQQTFPDEWENGKKVDLSRAWVVWHVLEHDLAHGGEVSLTLGIHNLQGEFTS